MTPTSNMAMARTLAVLLAALSAWINSFAAQYRSNGRARTMTAAQCAAT